MYGLRVKPFRILSLGSALLIATLGSSASAHPDVEVAGVIGARVGGSARLTDSNNDEIGKASVNSSLSYGGLAGYRLQPNGFGYISYSRQKTEMRYRATGSGSVDTRDVSIEYFQIGGYLEIDRGKFFPYLGFSVGAGRLKELGGSAEELRFSGVLDAGLKYQLLPILQLRLLARMPITILSGDAKVLCVSGAGCAATYGGQPFIQGEFQAGLGLTF